MFDMLGAFIHISIHSHNQMGEMFRIPRNDIAQNIAETAQSTSGVTHVEGLVEACATQSAEV